MAKVVVRTPTGRKRVVRLSDYRPYWLYDKEVITPTTTEVYFFQSPEGKALPDTNLKQFSTIQVGWEFEIHAIRVIPSVKISTADAEELFENSAITFYKEGDIEVFSAPTLLFPAGAGLYGATTETNTNILANGVPTPTAVNKLPIPIMIRGGETFNIRMLFQPPPSGLSGNVPVKMVLDGILRRPVKGT